MAIVVAIVGRPNVGKSTLFNRLTRSRAALVADVPGLTRDRQFGTARLDDRVLTVIDTGGVLGAEEGVDALTAEQSWQAVEDADVVLFVVDARAGATPADLTIAERLRPRQRVILVVNKCDGVTEGLGTAEFAALLPVPLVETAASHGRGMGDLEAALRESLEDLDDAPDTPPADSGPRFCIIGRPNTGKSTLVNALLGENRVVAHEKAGSTRDAIAVPFERYGRRYTVVDTAGIRRRGRVDTALEKFSIVKAIEAVQQADAAIVLMDGTEGIVEQDLHLVGLALDAGRSVVIALNKIDAVDRDQTQRLERDVDRRLGFLPFADVVRVSAREGRGLRRLFAALDAALASASATMGTADLNRMLERALFRHPPPLVRGRRIKIRFAHPGGTNPPTVVLHGNQLDALPKAYVRYLENAFREQLDLKGTPIRLDLRTTENPYAGRRNVLTERQKRRRKRMIAHHKKR
jgi:GTP-binding protein